MSTEQHPHKATAEELLPLIIKFAGIGLGNRAYKLQCRFCRDLGTVSASQRMNSDKALKKAAESFVKQGWRISGVPVCPKCFIKKY